MTTPTQLFTLLDACFDAQNEATALWHSQEPEADDVAPDASASPETLLALVRAQHLRNFRLWHIEDTARRRDVTTDVIADCKDRIDRLNQERNDRIERVDACLVALLSPLLPASPAPHINTESLGMAIDRLSILSLKIWHMDEQVRRTDVTPEHIASCEKKLAVLKEQRADLSLAVCEVDGRVADEVCDIQVDRVVVQLERMVDLNDDAFLEDGDLGGGGPKIDGENFQRRQAPFRPGAGGLYDVF